MRVTSRVLADLFSQDPEVSALLADTRCLGLVVLDLRDLEHAEAVRPHDGRSLPELLAAWRSDADWHDGSAVGLASRNVDVPTGGDNRPPLLATPLQEVFEAIERLLTGPERQDAVPEPTDRSASARAS
jgi:hypothetical protein